MRSKLLIVVLILSVLFISAFYLSGVMFDFVSQAYASCGGGGGNQPPVAILNPERSYAITGKLVILDGSSSYDPDGSITKYQWDFENDGIYDYYETSGYYPDGKFDGITRTKFDSEATHTVKLHVVDNQSSSDTDTADVNVSDDADANGLPDAWETDYDVSDATSDDDEDGYINFTEYLHDTVPDNPNSKPVGYSSVVTIWVPEDMENYTDANYIQTAINNAIDGDTIEIAEGTYYGAIDINDVNCTLTSTKPQDWTVVNNTIIDANDSNAMVVVIEDSQDSNCIIDGLTITGGKRGIYCDASAPVIRNCIIKNNENGVKYGKGAGIYNRNNSSPVIDSCFIINNDAYYGGGIYNYESSPSVINCVFSENLANYFPGGSGIYNYCSSPDVINCTFFEDFGSRMFNYGELSVPNVTNCIFWDDNMGTPAIFNMADADPNVTYCFIRSGYDSNDSNNNNISGDPDFRDSDNPAGPDGMFGTVDDGLQLWLDSNCVDAANGNVAPQTDILGHDIVDVNSISNTGSGDPNYADMGAYELPNIWFVDKDVSGGDGSSWTNAYDDLQDALSAADSGDEIWVADGTYEPNSGTDRTVSFELVEGVALYGGFDGTEILRNQRDWTLHQTVLSGDIQGSNNSYHVVVGADDAVLDGFKITDGVADDTGGNYQGGGIYCSHVSPTIRNCVIADNNALHGGGMYAESYAWEDGSYSPSIINCFFYNNSALYGGGIYNSSSSLRIANCVFADNQADDKGGGIYNGTSVVHFLLTNCTFAGNQAGYGGGIANNHSIYNADIINCIFWGNTADTDDQIYNYGAVPSFSFCDIQDSNGSGQNWDDDLGQDDGNNIDADPCFADINHANGNDTLFGTYDDGLRLYINSPCIDAADGDVATETDILNLARVDIQSINNTGGGNPNYTDIGVYEFAHTIYNIDTKLIYNTIQDAIDDSNTVDGHTLVIAKGTYCENNISYKGKAIKIRSLDPNNPDTVAATIIDGNDINVIIFDDGEDENSILEGITVTGGYCGIFADDAISPTISKCRIIGNRLYGVYSTYSSSNAHPNVVECTINDNGSGVVLNHGGTVTDCRIINNEDFGIAAEDHTNGWGGITIKNCVIAGNGHTGISIGSTCEDSVAISNCTIVNHSSYGIKVHESVDESITNCIVWGNNNDLYDCVASYSCVQDHDLGVGNIYSYPMFVDADNNDFHLWYSSRCIDAGDPNSDYSNEPDPNGGCINMGAYGNTDEATSVTDTDEDGLDDSWEIDNYLDPNDANDAVADMDGDSLRNIDEYYINWDPNSDDSSSIDGLVNNDNLDINFPGIQMAIDFATDDDILTISQGTYYENNISYNGKVITTRSTDPNDPNTVAAAIIDANDIFEDVIVFNNGEDSNSILEGITITGGDNGILCYDNSSPTISECRIVDNNDHGVRAYGNSYPKLVECTIADNWDDGLSLMVGGTVTGCRIINNKAFGIYGCDKITIKNCVITENTFDGIQILFSNDPVTIGSCTIAFNNGGIELGSSVDESITNCIIWGNGDDLEDCVASYSCIQDLDDEGQGNIHSDPCFVDYVTDDYHLRPASLCIDAGDPNSPYSNEPEPNGGCINMGAYGNTDEATTSSP